MAAAQRQFILTVMDHVCDMALDSVEDELALLVIALATQEMTASKVSKLRSDQTRKVSSLDD